MVIPCYNYAHYLGQALDSVLAQTWTDWEAIVVDDGSTDTTADVVAAYGGGVRYIYQDNRGLPAARNVGIRHAKGRFVAFLDADDRWLPGHLAAVMAAFARLCPQHGLVATRSSSIGSDGEPIAKVRRDQRLAGDLSARDIILRSCFSPSAVVVRREVFATCGLFDETLTSSEDRDMWIRVGAAFRLHLLADALVQIRDHNQSMSKHAERMKNNTRRVIRKARQKAIVPRHDLTFWLRVWAVNRFQCAWMYHDEGRWLKASGEMLSSIMTWPWFLRPDRINEPLLFRLRAMRRFACRPWRPPNPLAPNNAGDGQ